MNNFHQTLMKHALNKAVELHNKEMEERNKLKWDETPIINKKYL